MAELKFPKGFLWGASTSAHQVEGNTHNDWSEWERKNARRLAETAREGLSSGTLPSYVFEQRPTPLEEENYISGRACDHYNRFEEDFDIAKSLGHNAHRFSLEWSRIEPEPGVFNEEAILHYRDVLRALKARGMEPFVTLWHWTNPLWVRDLGGPESDEFVFYFTRYVKTVVKRLDDLVNFWITLNEPTSVLLNGYVKGVWPPQKMNPLALLRAFKNLAEAHNKAYEIIHRIDKLANVGFGNILDFWEPHDKYSALDQWLVKQLRYYRNERFLELTSGTHDFLAVQYYFHTKIAFPFSNKNENKRVSDMGWEIYPQGIYHILKDLKDYKLPIYITENGVADLRDHQREDFLRDHLFWVHRAIRDGVDVRGYFHWSLLDNFEWDKGFWPRFGLVRVNYKTLERRVRPSANFYAKIAKTNTLEL